MEESMTKTGRPPRFAGVVFARKESAFWWIRYPNRHGGVVRESTGTTDKQEAERFLRSRLDARDEGRLPIVLSGKNLTFNEWADWFEEKRSKPPFRSHNTHQQNLNSLKFLRPTFGQTFLSEITPEAIEDYIAIRLSSGRWVRTKLGKQRRGELKPSTVHLDFRVLNLILNLAVRQRRLAVNPCGAVEFPVPIRKSVRKPHYMTASEQARIELVAPNYLRNLVVILTEMGLRPHKELLPMKKADVDLENSLVHVPDSKTSSGIGDMPMTDLAREAFRAQIQANPASEYLFPSPNPRAKKPYITSLRKIWDKTLRRAGAAYFPIYHLRHTFATRLSAGGVADHFVTQMLRQGDSQVFKRYSQAKLNMMREALTKIDRHANEHKTTFSTARVN
jgi:integrase